jgi:hypothetical protein
MKKYKEKHFQHFDPEAINHYGINDCLDLMRKIQFSQVQQTAVRGSLIASLKKRILTLVLPGTSRFPSSFNKRCRRTHRS